MKVTIMFNNNIDINGHLLVIESAIKKKESLLVVVTQITPQTTGHVFHNINGPSEK